MYGLYKSYYGLFKNYSMVENCHFANVATPTKYGSWNLLEYQDQNPADCPRFSAIQDIINEAQQSKSIVNVTTPAETLTGETTTEAVTIISTETVTQTDAESTLENSTESTTDSTTESSTDATTTV